MDIHTELRESGFKATLPRLLILQLFHRKGVRHLSADDVFRLLRQENSRIALATIYRVLLQFVEGGVLLRRQFEGSSWVFELNEGAHHDHLVCTKCGRIEEFVDEAIERRQEQIATERGFMLAQHALSLFGTCVDCRAANKEIDLRG